MRIENAESRGNVHRHGESGLELLENVGLPDLSRQIEPAARRVIGVRHWVSEVYENAEAPIYEELSPSIGEAQG